MEKPKKSLKDLISEPVKTANTVKTSKPSFGGLTNYGNSCYYNVVIQSLYNVPVFRDFILSLEDAAYDKAEQCHTILQICETFDLYKEQGNRQASVILLKLSKKFDPKGKQNDAQEFLSFLFDKINKEAQSLGKVDDDDDEWQDVLL